MESLRRAAPGVEHRAEQAAETACHLADATVRGGWSTAAAEDALDAIDTLVEALGSVGDDAVAQALAVVAVATGDARRSLGIAVDDRAPEPVTAAVPAPRRPPRRRGLGPGYQGIRTEHRRPRTAEDGAC
ncbi:hypothetical protein ACH427_16855 [Streptomyces sp. NPDC020379]|uniref:hypothetical protein n=1 Tax=Streptomyces sp. NPDC020379 TaxID=3365071 RepID=UPI0037A502B3